MQLREIREVYRILQIRPEHVFSTPIRLPGAEFEEPVAYRWGGFYIPVTGAKGFDQLVEALMQPPITNRDLVDFIPGCSVRDTGEGIIAESDRSMMWQRIADFNFRLTFPNYDVGQSGPIWTPAEFTKRLMLAQRGAVNG